MWRLLALLLYHTYSANPGPIETTQRNPAGPVTQRPQSAPTDRFTASCNELDRITVTATLRQVNRVSNRAISSTGYRLTQRDHVGFELFKRAFGFEMLHDGREVNRRATNVRRRYEDVKWEAEMFGSVGDWGGVLIDCEHRSNETGRCGRNKPFWAAGNRIVLV